MREQSARDLGKLSSQIHHFPLAFFAVYLLYCEGTSAGSGVGGRSGKRQRLAGRGNPKRPATLWFCGLSFGSQLSRPLRT
jgi:hypothetical protein